jgi:hypothetical protein
MAIFLVSVALVVTLDVVSSSHLRKAVGGDASHVVVPDLGVVDSCVGGRSLFFVEGSTPFLVKVYVFVVKAPSFAARVVVVVCRVMSRVYVYPPSDLVRCPRNRKMTTENDVGSSDSCPSLELLLQV